MATRSVVRAARAEADRDPAVSSASSPRASPRPSSRITAPAASSTISSRPARTTYIASPGSSSRNSQLPAPTRTDRARNESASRSEGSRPAKSGTRPRKSAVDSVRAGGAAAASTLIARRARGTAGTETVSEVSVRRSALAASPSAGTFSMATLPTRRQPIPAANRHAAPKVHA